MLDITRFKNKTKNILLQIDTSTILASVRIKQQLKKKQS